VIVTLIARLNQDCVDEPQASFLVKHVLNRTADQLDRIVKLKCTSQTGRLTNIYQGSLMTGLIRPSSILSVLNRTALMNHSINCSKARLKQDCC
jgi:hypothetical protein